MKVVQGFFFLQSSFWVEKNLCCYLICQFYSWQLQVSKMKDDYNLINRERALLSSFLCRRWSNNKSKIKTYHIITMFHTSNRKLIKTESKSIPKTCSVFWLCTSTSIKKSGGIKLVYLGSCFPRVSKMFRSDTFLLIRTYWQSLSFMLT